MSPANTTSPVTVGGAETPGMQGAPPVQPQARRGEGVNHSVRPVAGSSAARPGLPGGEGMNASATPT
jgi:hypothetical protein